MGKECCGAPQGCSTEKAEKGCCSTEKTSCSTEKGSCSTEKGACGTGSCGTDKSGACGSGCCPVAACLGTVFKGALVGGMILFFWTAFSWHVLGWHKNDVMSFANDKAVATVLAANAPESGVYILPAHVAQKAVAEKTAEDKSAEKVSIKSARAADKVAAVTSSEAATKPYAFVSVFAEGTAKDDMKNAMYKFFLLCLVGGALLTKFVKKASSSKCCPVGCSAKVGLLVGLFSYLPNAIWFHFPLNGALVGVLDDVIAFALAGWAISKILPSSGGCGASCACGGKCPCCAGGGCSGKCGGKCPCPCCSEACCGDKKGGCCDEKPADCCDEKSSCGTEEKTGCCGGGGKKESGCCPG